MTTIIMHRTKIKWIHHLSLLICGLTFSTYVIANTVKEPVNPVEIKFDQAGAVYNPQEAGYATIKVNDTSLNKIKITILDANHKPVKKAKTYIVKENQVIFPFKIKDLGYYYLQITSDSSSEKTEEGFGVIPNVTLTQKDWDSPFGICGHYQRYKDWRIGDIQKKLGIAWVRDESDWYGVVTKGLKSDPYLDYLDSKNICWLALFNYIDAFNGIQGADSIWRWDADLSILKKYVQMHKGHFSVYESQNEPNNFGGWSKRWPHPQNQQWRPQGWGKPFADLIKQMYDSVKSVDPSLKLMWPGEDEWIEYFVKERDAAPYIDITSIHPYVNKSIYPETEQFASGFYSEHKKMLQEELNVPTEMWVTEVGWTTYDRPDKIDRYVPVTEYEQAAYLVRTYLLHLYYGASKVFWYEMTDEPFGSQNPESYFGIVRYPSFSVKPSAVAYSNMVYNYRHAIPIGKYKGSSYGFAYKNQGEPQLCIWREKDTVIETLSLPRTKKISVIDIFGREKTMKVSKGKIDLKINIYPLTIKGIHKEDFKKLYQSK